jgi:hypothetical protein
MQLPTFQNRLELSCDANDALPARPPSHPRIFDIQLANIAVINISHSITLHNTLRDSICAESLIFALPTALRQRDINKTKMADYNSMKVPELKKLLSERGLPQNGNKADLIARLGENDKQKAAETAEPQAGKPSFQPRLITSSRDAVAGFVDREGPPLSPCAAMLLR